MLIRRPSQSETRPFANKAKASLKKAYCKYRNGLLLFWGFDRITNAISRLGVTINVFIVYREGTVPLDSPAPKLVNCTASFATVAELSEVANVEDYPVAYEELIQRFAEGAECFILRHEARIVALTWCQLDGPPGVRLGLSFGAQDAYFFDAHTAPSYRGLDLLPYLRYLLCGEMQRRGRTNLLSATDAFNRPAHCFKRKLAARPLELRVYLRVFRRLERVFTLWRYRSA